MVMSQRKYGQDILEEEDGWSWVNKRECLVEEGSKGQ